MSGAGAGSHVSRVAHPTMASLQLLGGKNSDRQLTVLCSLQAYGELGWLLDKILKCAKSVCFV